MASQLGSAITPTGHQAYSDLLNTEQQNRAMAQQAFQNQQNMQLAQQQMGQQADQFATSLQEAERQRQHDLNLSQQGFQNQQTLQADRQKFEQAQQDAFMKWQERQTYDLNKMNLELADLDLQAQEAHARGEQAAAQQILATRQATKKMISQRAQKLAMAKAALGKSQEQVQGMFTSLVDQYEQVINGKQHELEIAKSHTPGFLGRLGASSIQSNIDAYNKTRAEKLGGFNYQFAPLAPDISHVQALVEAGDLPGFEYLQVDPSSWGRLTGALDFTELSSAKMVSGAVDANTITEGEKRKLSSALVDQFRGMKLPNFNEDAARRAVESALGDGDKTQLAQFAQQAGIPLSTMYHFLNEAAMGSEENTANPEWMKIMQLQARYRQQYGGQESLENMALEQAKNALKTRSSLARKAALKIDGSHTTLEDMRSAIEVIASMRRKGTLDSAGEALLGRFDAARLGELKKAQAAVPQAQTDAETAARELGDLAEMQSDDDVLAQIKAMYPQQAGIGANRAGIAALLGRMGPRP